VHKTSNALKITFQCGPGVPLAVGVQGAGNGRRAKLAILFGFNNGGAGKHRITYSDGAVVWVESKDGAPSVLSRGHGTEIATVQRGDTSDDDGVCYRPISSAACCAVRSKWRTSSSAGG
jgi:hypothetical protein